MAIAPLLLIWFGYGAVSKVLIAFLIGFFPIVVNTVAGLGSVEPEMLDLVRSSEHALDPVGGLAPDARFDVKGFNNVLAIRAEIEGRWDGRVPAPEKYYDLTYYQRALTAPGR